MTAIRRLERALVAAVTSDKPYVPEAGALLWQCFVKLSNARSSNGYGPNPISFAEIEAFGRFHRWPFSPHHVEIIRAMDDAWLENVHRKQDGGASAKTFNNSRYANAQPITAAGFDAVIG